METIKNNDKIKFPITDSLKRAQKKYYQTKCKIHDDMTDEQKNIVQKRIDKRNETSRNYQLKQKELIRTLQLQINNNK